MKRCIKCKVMKSLSEFNKNRTTKDGLQDWCKRCRRIYRQSKRGKASRVKAAKKYRATDKGKAAVNRGQKKRRETLKGYLRIIFCGMVQRCQNPKVESYEQYGGRGTEIQCTFQQFFHHITVTLGYDTYEKIKGLEIDRIDTNGHYELENIRVVTPSQNQMNSHKVRTWHSRPCSSRFKGVSWYKKLNKWRAYIVVSRKQHYLGLFTNEITAAEVYDQASLKYHGEFGATNESLGLFDRDC